MNKSKPNTTLLRRILYGIASGELAHTQKRHHCGTAHCIAGWVEVFQAQEQGYEYKWVENDKRFFFVRGAEEIPYFHPYDQTTWQYAQQKLKLTTYEAALLFDIFASFNQMCALAALLESGRRITNAKKNAKFLGVNPYDQSPPSLEIYHAHFPEHD